MKRNFEAPFFQVVRFSKNDIVTTSACCCDTGLDDFGPASNDTGCVGKNLPECTCGLDNPVNCV